jgi:hypothetical protein
VRAETTKPNRLIACAAAPSTEVRSEHDASAAIEDISIREELPSNANVDTSPQWVWVRVAAENVPDDAEVRTAMHHEVARAKPLRIEDVERDRLADSVAARVVAALVGQGRDAVETEALGASLLESVPAAHVPMPFAKGTSPQTEPGTEPVFMKLAEYAGRVGYSVRTIANFVDDGLPTVGGGRLRRVDVAAGDEWIRALAARRREARDQIEADAHEDARRGRTSRRSETK